MTEKESIKNVIALVNEFMDSKILYIDRSAHQILEAIAGSDEVYNLIADCLANFNKDKEFEKIFATNSNGNCIFNLPKEEVKIIAFVFCLLADISSGKINFEDMISKYFVMEDGTKDYHMFMQKVIVPFRDLLSEAFGVSMNITTIEALENIKEGETTFDEEMLEEDLPKELGMPRFNFKDVNLEKTFELARKTATQIYEMLELERKQTEEVLDGKDIINSIVIACDKQDFEMLYTLVIGVKYVLKAVKDVRFLVRELVDIVKSRLY